MSAEMAIFVVAVLAIVGWFALGTHINVRKGHQFLEWLQDGLPLVGEKTTLRWLGSSVVHLKVEKAQAPFRRVEVLIVLEPRDVPPLWLLSRLRGRRDLLILRTELRTVPKYQLEILDSQAWSTRAVEREVSVPPWQLAESPPFRIYTLAGGGNPADLLAEAQQAGLATLRIGVRRANHALELHWRLPRRPAEASARAVFEAAQRVASHT
jgi:hypothetical protein